MKNLTITAILSVMFIVSGLSQSFDQGQILIFGNSKMKITLADGSPWNMEVGGGYFLRDNICLGANIFGSGSSENSDISFNLFGRYYFLEKYYGGVTLIKGVNSDGDTKYYPQLEGGYIYALNDYIALEPNLKYLLTDGAPLVVGVNISLYIIE